MADNFSLVKQDIELPNKSMEAILVRAREKTQTQIKSIYLGNLRFNCFQGGWAEEPKYSSEDYAKYSEWIRSSATNSDDANLPFWDNLNKLILIGMNKVWSTLDQLANKYYSSVAEGLGDAYSLCGQLRKLDVLESAELQCAGISFSVRHKGYDKYSKEVYDYKQLHIVDASSEPKKVEVVLRPVSTEELRSVRVNGNGLSLSDAPAVQAGLVQYLQLLHSEIMADKVRYEPTLFFDSDRLEKFRKNSSP